MKLEFENVNRINNLQQKKLRKELFIFMGLLLIQVL